MKRSVTVGLTLILASLSCNYFAGDEVAKPKSIDRLIEKLENSTDREIIVIAHRGDWRNAPENSIQAIKNCILMGVDMVEIDVMETKDGHLILMHDQTVDRTTNGIGLVKDWTLDSLRSLRLVDGLGVQTQHIIPTLEEALLAAKDQILVNIDKGIEKFPKCYEIMKKTGTIQQVVVKGAKTRLEMELAIGSQIDEVYFMPIIVLPNEKAEEIVFDYIENRLPVAFEFVVPQDTFNIIKDFRYIREKGSSIWVNALWSDHNAGHDDEKAALNPHVYDWYVEKGIDMIQTDRPALLIDYLKKEKLHK